LRLHGAGQIRLERRGQRAGWVERWLTQVRELRRQAQAFLASHPNEDLETALKALEIAQGSLHEVAEHYE
jgi:hypothetical protein